jgi:hypothetical protein
MLMPTARGLPLYPQQVYNIYLGADGKDFVDPKDKFWSQYLTAAEEEDKVRVESWKGDTEGILVFVSCLYFRQFLAHVVGTRLVSSRRRLQRLSSTATRTFFPHRTLARRVDLLLPIPLPRLLWPSISCGSSVFL